MISLCGQLCRDSGPRRLDSLHWAAITHPKASDSCTLPSWLPRDTPYCPWKSSPIALCAQKAFRDEFSAKKVRCSKICPRRMQESLSSALSPGLWFLGKGVPCRCIMAEDLQGLGGVEEKGEASDPTVPRPISATRMHVTATMRAKRKFPFSSLPETFL